MAIENIGLIRELESVNSNTNKSNAMEVLETFNKKPVIIDYKNLINWDEIKNLSNEQKDQIVYNTLKKFLKKHHIKKILLSGDPFNYNEPPYHPEPQGRKFFTKATAQMEKEGSIKILGICGGMQGIMFYNGVKLNSVAKMLKSKEKALEYRKAASYSINDSFNEITKKFSICQAKLNKIFISQRSKIGQLMLLAEKKYNIKYNRDKADNLIIGMPAIHYHAVDSFDKNNLKKIDEIGFDIVGLSDDKIVYIVENKKNGDLLVQGHPEIVANTTHCPEGFDKRDVIFSRLLFYNFLSNKPIKTLPNNLLPH